MWGSSPRDGSRMALSQIRAFSRGRASPRRSNSPGPCRSSTPTSGPCESTRGLGNRPGPLQQASMNPVSCANTELASGNPPQAAVETDNNTETTLYQFGSDRHHAAAEIKRGFCHVAATPSSNLLLRLKVDERFRTGDRVGARRGPGLDSREKRRRPRGNRFIGPLHHHWRCRHLHPACPCASSTRGISSTSPRTQSNVRCSVAFHLAAAENRECNLAIGKTLLNCLEFKTC